MVSWEAENVRRLLVEKKTQYICEQTRFAQRYCSHIGADLYLPVLRCCFCAAASSCCDSAPGGCLKTTGARDIVLELEVLEGEGSRRLAYSDKPARVDLDVLSGGIVHIVIRDMVISWVVLPCGMVM